MVEHEMRSYSRHFPQFMEFEGSLQYSKQPATGPYLVPEEYSSRLLIEFIESTLILSYTYAPIF
jgi:hypothetical protein